jgi:hypothetical protein
MYSQTCPLEHDLVLWAQQQINIMATNYTNAPCFIAYLKNHWLHKVEMWFIGNCNIPHVGRDTNAIVESFHSNIKWIFYSSKYIFIERGHKHVKVGQLVILAQKVKVGEK